MLLGVRDTTRNLSAAPYNDLSAVSCIPATTSKLHKRSNQLSEVTVNDQLALYSDHSDASWNSSSHLPGYQIKNLTQDTTSAP